MSGKYKIFSANPYPLGVRREGKDIYASMVSDVEDCGILLYSSKETKNAEKNTLKIPFPAKQKIGHVYSMKIEGIPAHYDGYRLYRGEEIFVDEYGTCYKNYPYGTSMEPAQMMGVLGGKVFDWEKDKKPGLAFSDSVFYGLHVRGFTMHESSKCRHRGTFAGVKEKLEYLQELGITSVLLMPAYEFIENELGLNYWGYKEAYYYAPKASYAAGKDPCAEFKQLVKACHAKGMELLMQFYFTKDVSDTEMARILEYWTMEYHVDGFRILTERDDIDVIQKSPILADTKLIFRDFRQTAGFKRFCVYKDDTKRDYRRFLKGDNFMVDAVKYHFCKNGTHKAYMNSIADYHGFRLMDLVSYDRKHNEANGEGNADGEEANYSWNCGAEGVTDNPRILALRTQQIKNALSLILLSQGTPYLFMGDEMGSTQYGNNNPYNQDNEISWLDWNCMTEHKEIHDFVKGVIAFRNANPFLHMEEDLDGRDYLGYGYPNISFHGNEAYRISNAENCKELGILLCGEADAKVCKLIYIACNMHWLPRKLALPRLKNSAEWQVVWQTNEQKLEQTEAEHLFSGEESHIEVPARTIVVLEAVISKMDGMKEKHITAF